uniref:Doublecortin domain-containing protein n=6 Tax=Nothobranchius TaxID=28779 RepID=A0A8C6KCP7_NOTFU
MAIHKRSFKCFDALLDDLSQKVPLPFGVRTVTTPRGTHTIKHLEQLQDGGCYLCSDRRQAKPINMDLASKRQGISYHHSWRPQRPETSFATPPGPLHFPHRQRRILLVKNSEPSVRRSVVLSRRSARSLKAFLDEVSEVMQFHVRKLYTAEGRRIDSAQSLMTCPGVLVCVGREAFSPTLVNFIRKSSEEKLPGLGSKSPGLGPRIPGNGARSATHGVRSSHGAPSRASEYDEKHDSRKKNNFGLETKKSVIHPRSDSSTRSTRFSLSSEKSYGACSQARPAIMNDDIEKRVLVNKDGSLSVEMRVRFHLQNNETIHWSTQIKKSPSLTNDCCPPSQAQTHYLQKGRSETCSDPDSTSYEGVDYSSQLPQCALEENHYPCCYQKQDNQFDLWENPAIQHCPVPPTQTSSHTMRHTHSSSSSSSCNTRRVVRCRARLSRSPGGLESEQSQVFQKEMCMTEQVERRVEVSQEGDTQVEVCKVSQCCSQTEVVAMDANLQPPSRQSVEGELMIGEDEGRPLSTVSSSSRILQSLKEDQDDEEYDLPPSASQCSHRNEPSPSPTPVAEPDEEPASVVFTSSVHSVKSHTCHCGAATPVIEADGTDRAPTSRSNASKHKSEEEIESEISGEEVNRAVSGLSHLARRPASSQKSWTSNVCSHCGGWKQGVNSNSSATNQSNRASLSADSKTISLINDGPLPVVSNTLEGTASIAMSATSDPDSKDKGEGRCSSNASAASHRSNMSAKSNCNDMSGVGGPSALSVQSNQSVKSSRSKCTNEDSARNSRENREEDATAEKAASSLSNNSGSSVKSQVNGLSGTKGIPEEGDPDKRAPSVLSVKSHKSSKTGKAESVLSDKSHVSAKSGTSHKSVCNHCAKALSDEPMKGAEAEERSTSVVSAKSHHSAKTNQSHNSTKASEQPPSPRPKSGEDVEERTTSQMSGKLSVISTKSSNCKDYRKASSPSLKVEDSTGGRIEAETQRRPESVKSAKSKKETSARPDEDAKSHCTNTDIDSVADRSPSATSGRSHASAKSSKSQSSNHSKSPSNPLNPDSALIETNTDEKANDSGDNLDVMSVKSKSSVKSSASHKSNCSRNTSSPNVTIISQQGEEDPCVTSENLNDTVATETVEEGEPVDDSAPKSSDSHDITSSPKRTPSPRIHTSKQLSPNPVCGETRGSSALSVHSTTLRKTGRSRCCCEAASALEKENNINEGEDEEDVNSEGAFEQAVSILSSASKRQRKGSGVTEQTLSRISSRSTSLELPEDHETAGSEFSAFSKNSHGKIKGQLENSQRSENSSAKEDMEKIEPTKSPPAVDIPTIKTPEGGKGGGEEHGGQHLERAASASTVKSSRSHKSCCRCRVTAASQLLDSKSTKRGASSSPNRVTNADDTESTKSASATQKMYTLSNETSSAVSERVGRKSPSNASTNPTKDTAGVLANSEYQVICRAGSETRDMEDIPQNKTPKSQNPCSRRPESVTSTQSESKTSLKPSKVNHNPVKDHKTKSPTGSEACLLHNPKSGSKTEASSESTLSHSLSAADLLKETMAAVRPRSQQSKTSKTSDNPQTERSELSQRSRNQRDQENFVELTPECLPNASPNEVVNDWLRSIPANSSMLALDNELNEDDQMAEETSWKPEEEAKKEELNTEEEQVDIEEKSGPQEEEKEDKGECDTAGQTLGDPVGTSPSSKNWQGSAAVMKVLLGSSFGRCRSMPEVSPVYGRRLSTSARGLLDCLAQLQVIEPAMGFVSHQQKDQRPHYDEIMAVLQSLWLTEPSDIDDVDTKKKKGVAQVTPPTSSSGVGMSSGSDGSGKGNGNQGEDESPAKETESVHEEEPTEKVVEEEDGNGSNGDIEMEPEKTSEADTAEELMKSEEQRTVPQSLESLKATENPSTLDKSSANDSSKSLTDNERETLEDSHSATPPTVLRAPLSKRPSQDPDPVWVLNLLKKLEKQFMSHYIEAMTEFKVRWDLDDSLILDTMISELKDEVSQRIQNSIQREIRKIQSRAGKGGRSPRPPGLANISRDSTMTERRRRMLKVMKNQSVKTADSVSDEELTGSDQRSDDEYCPCEACVRKKIAARPFKKNPLAAEAPVMMEFDLRKILQLKKNPSPTTVTASQPTEVEDERTAADEEGRNLEVVEEEEEEEETKQDIKAGVNQETSGENEELEELKEEHEKECTCQSAEDGEESNKKEEGDEEEGDTQTVKEAAKGEEKESGKDSSEDVVNEPTLVEGDDGDDEEKAGSQEEDGEGSEEEGTSPQGLSVVPVVCLSEGEAADAEDSDNSKDEESGHEEVGASGNEEDKEENEVKEDIIEEKATENENDDGTLLHQFTKTSVESQPGSMEDIVDTDSPTSPTEAQKAADDVSSGGSQSCGRIKQNE